MNRLDTLPDTNFCHCSLDSHFPCFTLAPPVHRCRRLVLEWNAYIARTSALRHVFVSVKGFYYQADVEGCSVTWLVPHQLAQVC
jgi:hypothetical protein